MLKKLYLGISSASHYDDEIEEPSRESGRVVRVPEATTPYFAVESKP